MTLKFTFDEEKCFDVLVTDGTVRLTARSEPVNVQVLPVGFPANLSGVLNPTSGVITSANDTVVFEACLPDCPYEGQEVFSLELRANDRTCPLPLIDTSFVVVQIELPPNNDPFFENLDTVVFDTLREGDTYRLPLTGIDIDNDNLEMRIVPINFSLSDILLSLEDSIISPGRLVTNINWPSDCDLNRFGLDDDLLFYVLLDDEDQCLQNNTDSLLVNLHVILPPNTNPKVTTSLPAEPDSTGNVLVELTLDELINFTVFGNDEDGDLLDLFAIPDGPFTFTDLNIQFTDVSGRPPVSSQFTMQPTCDQLRNLGDTEFTVSFIVNDDDTCKRANGDTLRITFSIVPPPNARPVLAADGLELGDTLVVNAGEVIDIPLVGTDADGDSLQLLLTDFTGPDNPNFTFGSQPGLGTATGRLTWPTTCASLGDEPVNQQATYTLVFVLFDNNCLRPAQDSLGLTIVVSDVQGTGQITLPPNVFTPNGDGINETYTIPELPAESCSSAFLGINIYNRWGTEVFSSDMRDFGWDGSGASPGVYYYQLRYSNITYKGIISLVR